MAISLETIQVGKCYLAPLDLVFLVLAIGDAKTSLIPRPAEAALPDRVAGTNLRAIFFATLQAARLETAERVRRTD